MIKFFYVLKFQTVSLKQMKSFIFDWDNTLVDSWSLLEQAVNHTFRKMGKPEITLSVVQYNAHLSTKDSFPTLFGDSWQEASNYFYQFIEEKHLQTISLLNGAQNLIHFLYKKNIPMAIVSNKKSEILNKEINHLGWSHNFVKIVGSGDALRDKPSPEPAWLACQYLNCDSKDIYFVGDSLPDWQCAEAIGANPIAIVADRQDNANYPPLIFSDLIELHDFFKDKL